MIPHILKMEGFGSYLEETVVDFDMTDDIFLISGATGAGKSLILDAMTYALYGRGAGDRSDFISKCLHGGNRRMNVSLTFESGGKTYEFQRHTSFPRSRKKDAESENFKTSAVVFELKDGEQIQLNSKNTDTEVNGWAEKLLHMSLEQFRQMIILPQGKAEALLTGNSKDKQELFTELFGTKRLEQIEEKLKNKATAAKNELKTLEGRLENYYKPEYETAKAMEEDIEKKKSEYKELSEQCSALKEKTGQAEKALEAAKELADQFDEQNTVKLKLLSLQSRKEEYKQKNDRLAELKRALQLKTEYRTFRDRANDLNSSKEGKKSAEELKEKTEKAAADAERALNEHRKGADAADEARKNADKVSEYIENQKEISELKADLDSKTASRRTAENEYNKISAEYEECKARSSEAAEKVQSSDLNALYADLDKQKEKKQLLEQGKVLLEQAEKERQNADAFAQNAEKLSEEVKAAEKAENALRDEYDRALDIHLNSLAAELSEKLTEGEKCPVCGSIHHPEPYHMLEEAVISAADVRKLKTKSDSAADHTSDLHNRLKTESNRMTEAENKMNELLSKVAEYGYSEEAYKAACEDVAKADGRIKEYIQLKDISDKLINKSNALRNKLDAAKALYNEKNNSAELAEQAYDLKMQSFSETAVQWDDPEKVLAEYNKAVTDYIDTENALRSNFNALSQKLISAEAQLESAENTLEQVQEKYDAARAALESKLKKNAVSVSADEFVLDENGLDTIDDLSKECVEYEHRLKETSKKLKELNAALEGKVLPDVQKCESNVKQLQNEYEQALKLSNSEETNLKRLKKNYDGYSKEKDKFDEFAKFCDRLSGFSEKIYGSRDMSFSRYVLGIMLDDVLDKANTMLERILDSNYRLYRRMEGKKSGKTGLDINVVNYSVDSMGADYPVKELSGGEKFVMSVILGLAISEAAQSRAGGINIDSMFIDEGFGTLDEETLARIMDILRTFGRGKKIGIISHVESLSSALSGFEVVRTAVGGSSIKVNSI